MKKIVFLAIFFLTVFVLIPQNTYGWQISSCVCNTDFDCPNSCPNVFTSPLIGLTTDCYYNFSNCYSSGSYPPTNACYYNNVDRSYETNCPASGCANSSLYYYNLYNKCDRVLGWQCEWSGWTDCAVPKCENNYQSFYNGSCVGGTGGSCQYTTEICDTNPGCLPGNIRYSSKDCNNPDKRCAAINTEDCDGRDKCVGKKYVDYSCSGGSCEITSEACSLACGAECTTPGATTPYYSSGGCAGTKTCQADCTWSTPSCSVGTVPCTESCSYKTCSGNSCSVDSSVDVTGVRSCLWGCGLTSCLATCPSDLGCSSDADCKCKVKDTCVSTACYNGDVWCKDDCGRWNHIATACSDNNSCTNDSCSAGSCQHTSNCPGSCHDDPNCPVACPVGSVDYCATCAHCGNGICDCQEATTTCSQDCSATVDFSISTNPISGSVAQGSAISTNIIATLNSGSMTQTVFFAASGLPSGASASFVPASCSPDCGSTMTINTLITTPTGTYSVNVCGTGGGQTRCVTYGLTITPAVLGITPPLVTTGAASSITPTSVTLNGTLSSLGGATSALVWFQWGPTASYGNSTPVQVITATGTFSANISGLNPNITYYFRARAKNGGSW